MASDEESGGLHGIIGAALSIGISKKELFDNYYPHELPLVFESFCNFRGNQPLEETVDAQGFFGF